jgi:prolyl-tRNA editing enzyme YbaK/EbsC (Cys-tRNA(Pro) deacylase)
MEPFNPEHVQQVLDEFDLDLKIMHFEQSTATAQEAADAIGCQLGQIAKSLCFMVNGEPVLVVASGDQTVDDRKLAAYFEVGRKKVKTAKPEQCVAIFGYAPGGVAPVGHRTAGIPVLIDSQLSRFDPIYAAAGAPDANFGLTVAQLKTITNGTVIDCHKEP